jgi:serine/threonine protein kinase
MLKRVLIAIDDAASREETKRNLTSWGYEVVVAANGMDAWKVLQSPHAPRIALFDRDLSGLSALELCRRARDLRGDNGFLLVLASSAESGGNHEALEALEAGADGVVGKPIHPRELRMRLAAGLRGRRLLTSDAPASLAPPLSIRPTDEALAGRVVARKYRLERIIGKGGMGTVWQATHLSLGMRVAIKFIKGDYARQAAAKARFELEAKAAASLRTKYAVKVFDCGVTTGGVPYLVMEYLEGLSLLSYVQTCGPLSFAQTVTLVAQAAQALGEAHARGMIHRDVKPDNILLCNDPDSTTSSPLVAKLIDFGVVKLLGNEANGAPPGMMATGMGVVVGTPNFMAPEQLFGGVQPDVAADLWALAACAFTAITGRIPFEGSSMSEVLHRVCKSRPPVASAYNSSVPAEFDRWFAQACDPDPAKRFGTARELAAALARAHAAYADACLELTPSLSIFVAQAVGESESAAPAVPEIRRFGGGDAPAYATFI